MSKSLESYIQIYEEVIPSNICNQIVYELKKGKWEEHNFYDPISDMTYKKNNNNLSTLASKITIQQNFLVNIQGLFKNYLELHNLEYFKKLTGTSDVAFHRYTVGSEMALHCDHIHSLFDGEKKGVPVLSAVGLLDNNFTGGKLIFFEDTEIDLRKGDIVIFPSNFLYPHRVTPVTDGTRYSHVAWAW